MSHEDSNNRNHSPVRNMVHYHWTGLDPRMPMSESLTLLSNLLLLLVVKCASLRFFICCNKRRGLWLLIVGEDSECTSSFVIGNKNLTDGSFLTSSSGDSAAIWVAQPMTMWKLRAASLVFILLLLLIREMVNGQWSIDLLLKLQHQKMKQMTKLPQEQTDNSIEPYSVFVRGI